MAVLNSDIEDAYRRYIDACNAREFDTLGDFVAHDVVGVRSGLYGYTQALRNLTLSFPDIQWAIEDLVIANTSLAARLTVTGTHRQLFDHIPGTGYAVSVQELAVYHLRGLHISHCWGDLETVLKSALTKNEYPH